MIRDIITLDTDSELLRAESREIDFWDYGDYTYAKKVLEDLRDTYKYQGDNIVGLAAVQIGEPVQIFLYSDGKKVHEIINPKFVPLTKQRISCEEGCLSEPSEIRKVKRFAKIAIEARGIDAKPIHKTLSGFDSIVFQHEYDHLRGKLIVDY